MKIYYTIPLTELLDDLTFREFQNQTILFSRKIKPSI